MLVYSFSPTSRLPHTQFARIARTDPESTLFLVPKLEIEVGELKSALRESQEAARNAERLQREAEEDSTRQRADDKKLLERLLGEQRTLFEAELRKYKDMSVQLAARKDVQVATSLSPPPPSYLTSPTPLTAPLPTFSSPPPPLLLSSSTCAGQGGEGRAAAPANSAASHE